MTFTAVLMKCFESIIKKHICNHIHGMLDNHQFAYKECRCVEDAVTTLLDTVGAHLDKTKTYCRVLFIDFTSAFNTIQPHVMLNKLHEMKVNGNLIRWIYSYLTLIVCKVK